MILGVPAEELIWLAVLIVVGAAFTGVLAGLFGVGGGAVIVPILYEVYRSFGVPEDVRMQLCIGTSLAIIIPTAIRAFYSHRARGGGIPDLLRRWAFPIVVGVATGGAIAAIASANFLKAIFALFAAVIAARLLFGRESWRLGDSLPGPFGMKVSGFLIGICSALMGVGGGAVSNMVLSLYGQSMHNVVAVAAGLGVLVSIPGTIAYAIAGLPYQDVMPPFSIGFVSLLGVLVFAPVSVLTAPLGVRLAYSLSKRKLEIAFGLFLVGVSLRFFAALLL